MEMKYSREFTTLAHNGNYLRTAEDLFMAQSTLSTHIQALEKSLGQKLFYRSSRTIELTEFGRNYLSYAEQIVQIEDKCQRELLSNYGASKKRIYLGINANLMPYGIPSIINGFRNEFDIDNIELVTANCEELSKLLLDHMCDLAIVRESDGIAKLKKAHSFDYSLLYKDPLVLVTSQSHPLARQEQVSWNDLREMPILSMPENSLIHRRIISECYKHGFEPYFLRLMDSSSSILDSVAAGYGVALLGAQRMKYSPCSGIKTVLLQPMSYIGIYLMTIKNQVLAPPCQALFDYFLSHKDTLV